MRVPFELTRGPSNQTQNAQGSAPIRQPLSEIIDISAFDSIEFLLTVNQVVMSKSFYGASLVILTGMQAETDQGWVKLCSFPPIVSSGWSCRRTVRSGMFQYVRWSLPMLPFNAGVGPATSINFSLSGYGHVDCSEAG